MLYIYDPKLGSTVNFKTFLKDFSIGFDVKPGDEKAVDGGKIRTIDNFSIVYNFGLDIPALSVNDARVNAGRMEQLDRMLSNNFGSSGNRVFESERVRYVLLSNLIHNGNYTEQHAIEKNGDVLKYGMPCYMSSFNYNIDTELGYFEYKNKLFPKAFDTTFSLITQVGEIRTGKFLIAGLEENGSYYNRDVQTWPFGVK